MEKQRPSILFVHNTLMWYTRPLFIKLSRIYDMRFIFTHVDIRRDVYGLETSGLEELDDMAYRVVKRRFHGISPSGIPLGLIKDLFRERYDLVVAASGSVEMLLCFLAARLRNKAIILRSEVWGWRGISPGNRLAWPLINYMITHADAMLVPGTKHREYFISRGVSPGRVFLMPNASNITIKKEDCEEKDKLREKLDIGSKKVILYVGRLTKRKGIEYLMEAFANLRRERDDIALIIVGRGESGNELERLGRSLNIADDTRFAGYVDGELLPPYYLLCDICVVPSITHEMGDPWVFILNEAMAAGKPVVATDAVGAAFDMIKDGENGFMVPERDSDALYQAMKTILADPALGQRMGEASGRILERGFTYERMIEGFGMAVASVQKRNR